MSRKNARESVFKLVFEYIANKEPNLDSLNIFLDIAENQDDKDYIKNTYLGVIEKYKQITDNIAKYSVGFSLDRIYQVDLAILVLAIYEIENIKSIPLLVSINEALNISKIYSTDKSTQFINGILTNFKKSSGEDGK